MDNALNALLSWQFILFALSINGIVWIIRTIIEFIWKNAVGNNLWENLILRLLPPSIGCVIALFATNFAYPDGLITFSGREMFGFVAGLFSSATYAVANSMLKNKIAQYVNSTNALNVAPQQTQLLPPQNLNQPPSPPGVMGTEQR